MSAVPNHVHAISSLSELDTLRGDWERVHALDPHATPFNSWSWVRGWLEHCRHDWTVLVARAADEPVALLPLALDNRGRIAPRVLRLATEGAADYNGWVCRAEASEAALPALAGHVREALEWDTLTLSDVDDPRLDLWCANFQGGFRMVERAPSTTVRMRLPASWTDYVETLDRGARKRVTYVMRRIERNIDYRVVELGSDGDPELIDVALRLWQQRWNLRDDFITPIGAVLRRCHAARELWLRVAYDGPKPVAAIAALPDRPRGRFHYYFSAFDRDYAKLSPGMVIVAEGIRHAIEAGFGWFDFLRGEEAYKTMLGGQPATSRNLDIHRRLSAARMRRVLHRGRRRWRRLIGR